jgi:flagellar biosynthesis/type III secretory pathway chaperone
MDSLKKLIEIMDSMVDAHTRLLEFAKEKRLILISGDNQSLLNITHRENSCANEIEKLERERKSFVQEYIESKGQTGTSFTLEEIIGLQADEEIKFTIHSLAQQLRLLVQEISQLNTGNQQMIETSLSYIQYSIGMFVQKETPIGYGPKSKKGYSNLLDAKV